MRKEIVRIDTMLESLKRRLNLVAKFEGENKLAEAEKHVQFMYEQAGDLRSAIMTLQFPGAGGVAAKKK